MAQGSAQNNGRGRADVNRERRINAVRMLDRLLNHMLNPAFTGKLSFEMFAKDGHLGEAKAGLIRVYYDNVTDDLLDTQ